MDSFKEIAKKLHNLSQGKTKFMPLINALTELASTGADTETIVEIILLICDLRD